MKRRIAAVFLCVLLLVCAVPMQAAAQRTQKAPAMEASDTEDFYYRFAGKDTVEITGYCGYDSDVVVPSMLDGYAVIGVYSFGKYEESDKANDAIRTVTLPEGVQYITANAFDFDTSFNNPDSNLRQVFLPQSLREIGECAFRNSTIEKIVIPAGVERIETGAFENCWSLESIEIHGEDTYLASDAFGTVQGSMYFSKAVAEAYQTWLYAQDRADDFFVWHDILMVYDGESLTPEIPQGVRGINGYAFAYRQSITAVTIPDSVEYIGSHAFEGCALTQVTIPGSVERIENGAFEDCASLASVSFSQGLKYIGYGAFRDTALSEVILPQGLEEVDYDAFYVPGIISVSAPDSLWRVDPGAFSETAWYAANFPDGAAVYIGSAFLGYVGYERPEHVTVRSGTRSVHMENASDIKTLELPDGLKSLYLRYVYELERLTVPESVEEADVGSLWNAKELILPQECKIARGSFSECNQLKEITVPRGNQTLSAFAGCARLERVTIPDDVIYVESIGGKLLKEVSLGSSVRMINGFSGCEGLREITLPESVVRLGDNAFSGCTALQTIRGGETVKKIGENSFSGCVSLLDLGQIGGAVTYIGHTALENTAWYAAQPNGVVYFGNIAYCYKGEMPQGTVLALREGTTAVADGFVFDQAGLTPRNVAYFESPGLAELILPQSCKTVGAYAFYSCESLAAIDLGGVREVGDDAFCTHGAKAIVLPQSMRYIGEDAFTSRVMTVLSLNEGLRAVGEGAFFATERLRSVYVPQSVNYLGERALGYCPDENDESLILIPGFTLYGAEESAAQAYAALWKIPFSAVLPQEPVATETMTVSPTCQNEGYTLSIAAPGGESAKTDMQQKRAHATVPSAPGDADCTRGGYSGGTHCGMCGKILSAPHETAPLGHAWGRYPEQDQSSPYYGMTRLYCPRCGRTEYEAGTGGGETHVHSYVPYLTPPSCTASGYTSYVCACGERYTDDFVPPLGHDFAGGVCRRCGVSEAESSKPCDGGAACPGKRFTDMPSAGNWAHAGIDYAVANGLFSGMSDTTFEPGTPMTRAMLVRVLWLLDGSPAHDGANPFSDVKSRDWFYDGVVWAAQRGIVAGMGEGKFAPNEKITREQIAAILYRYTATKAYDTSGKADLTLFPDNGAVSGWAYDALAWANASGYISGNKEGDTVYLRPQNKATRAQVASILMRYCKAH